MTVMNPWGFNCDSRNSTENAITVDKTHFELKFEDNFEPEIPDSLPDSEQYLALLEEKLRKIRNDSNILKQLQNKREACMREFLHSDSNFEIGRFDAPISNSNILRTVLPQRQALNQLEIIQLIKHDQLSDSE